MGTNLLSMPLAAGMAPKPQASVAPAPRPMGPSPFAMTQQKPNLLQSALNGFQMGFDPKAYDARMKQEQGDALTKQKQTLALMQQQRALPENQRIEWWQQNAPQISQIIGKDVSTMPINPAQFSDQALDGQIAMLSAQMGQGPATPEPMTAYQQAQLKLQQDEAARKANAPVVVSPGSHGYQQNEDGSWEDVFSVPGAPGTSPGGRVQSTFIDKDGQLWTVMADGQVVPKGIQARDSLMNVDVGGVPFIGSRYQGGMAPIATPQQVGTNKAGIQNITAKGEAQTQAQIDLPQTIANAEQSLNVIDQLLAHPKAPSRYGMRGVLPPLPGEEAGAQAYIDQIGGNAFLQAYNSLKGGGQITEVEGAKATQAITRLTNQWQDWDSAKKAAQELRQIIENGLLRAKAKAGQLDFSQLTDAQIDALAQSN